MIVLFLGVSSVGKTTIMKELAGEHSWKWLPVHMSRNVREDEYAKTKVKRKEIESGIKSGDYLWVNEIYGNIYATPKEPIIDAEQNDNFFMLDFPIEKKQEAFKNIYHKSIIVMPESISQLINQAMDSGRSDRIQEILNNYHEYYSAYESDEKTIEYINQNDLIVVNHTNQVKNTAELINDSIKKQ